MLTLLLRRTVFAALLFAASRAAAQCPDGTPPPCAAPRRIAPIARTVPAPDARARRFLLLPFRNVTRVAAQDWLVTGAPLMLGESLGQFHDLSVVSEEKLTAARRRLSIRADSQPDVTQLRRLAEETDGWTAVSGNVYASGPKLRIEVQATDVPSARVITRARTEIPIDADVRQAFDSLTVLLLAPTGVRAERADLAALTTQSVDAYRAYVRGLEMMQRSAFHRAQQAFTEAVTLDSTFALAWARLAYSSVNADFFNMLNPGSPAVRALEQAARLSARLPARQGERIRAQQNFLRGQTRRAKQTLDSLATTDRDDLDSRELLSGWLLMDMDLDTVSGPVRLVSSVNRSLQLAREVLDRDPGRRNVHFLFAHAYAVAGGWWAGMRMGVRGEFPSFMAKAARLMQGPDAAFVPVVRDSIVLMPLFDFMRLPALERARLRRQSADVGVEWVDRWLLAGPQDAEAHLWASRFAELRDDAPRALREFDLAVSLGLESAWENGPQRRLELLVRSGEAVTAANLADSLLKAGSLVKPSLMPLVDHGRGYGLAAFLLTRRWTDAAALLAALPRTAGGEPGCASALNQLANTTGEVSGAPLRATADSVATNLMSVAAIQPLAPCLGNLMLLLNDSTAGRRTVAGAALLAVADSLHRAGGHDALAYRAAAWSWAVDTTRQAALSTRRWFTTRSLALGIGGQFAPASATLAGDSVVFAFRLADVAQADSVAADSTEWSFRAEMSGGPTNDAVVLDVSMGSAAPGAPVSGRGVLALVTSMRVRKAREWPAGVLSDRTTATASMQASPDGFVLVVRGPFVADVKRVRPPTATFSAAPCIAVSNGLCGRPAIPISYR